MIAVTPFDALGAFRNEWLDTHYHFSFADYHDPARMGLGALRVWNDDTIQPRSGFPMHGHRDMEIVTYVRTGAITHQDNLGNRGVTAAGDVQVMHAGTGILHSEMNEGDVPTRLFQIWVLPDRARHEPGWQTRRFPTEPVTGALPVLASGRAGHDGALGLNQDAAVLGGRMAAGAEAAHVLGPGRVAYLVAAEGEIEVNGVAAATRDGIAVSDEDTIAIKALTDAEIVLLDVPAGE